MQVEVGGLGAAEERSISSATCVPPHTLAPTIWWAESYALIETRRVLREGDTSSVGSTHCTASRLT